MPAGTQCLKPVVQEVLTISPFQRLYRIGDSIELTCPKGFAVAGPSRYTCKGDSWTPPISNSLTCEKGEYSSRFWILLRWCSPRLITQCLQWCYFCMCFKRRKQKILLTGWVNISTCVDDEVRQQIRSYWSSEYLQILKREVNFFPI